MKIKSKYRGVATFGVSKERFEINYINIKVKHSIGYLYIVESPFGASYAQYLKRNNI